MFGLIQVTLLVGWIHASENVFVFELERVSKKDGRRLESYEAVLENYNNVQYQLAIDIGSSRQRFNVVPDTGSSDLWIPAINCTGCLPTVERFDIGDSTTAKPIGDEVKFQYGDGTLAHGVTFIDTVRVGNLKVTDQFLVQIDMMTGNGHMKSDGILGLAHYYSDGNKTRFAQTFLTTVFERHPKLKKEVSFFLSGTMGETSRLFFGEMDYKKYAKERPKFGKSHYTTETHLWLTSVWSIGFGGTGAEFAFPEYGTNGAPSLVDSGSSLLVFDPQIYYQLMNEMQRYLYNCRVIPGKESIQMCDCPASVGQLPTLSIKIISDINEDFQLCISPDEYMLDSIDPLTGAQTCVPSFELGSIQQPVPIIFGMTFFRSFVVTFDVDENRIGFARSIQSPLPPNMKCDAFKYPILRRGIWISSIVVSVFALTFSAYVICWTPRKQDGE